MDERAQVQVAAQVSDPAVEPSLAPAPDASASAPASAPAPADSHATPATPDEVTAAAEVIRRKSTAEYAIAVEELAELTTEAVRLRERIMGLRRRLRLDALERPLWACLRCGHKWRGHRSGVPPMSCARCHSQGWKEPPRYPKRDRSPGDTLAPSWRTRTPRARRIAPATIVDADQISMRRARQHADVAKDNGKPAVTYADTIYLTLEHFGLPTHPPPPPPPMSPPPLPTFRPLAEWLREQTANAKETADAHNGPARPLADPPEPAPASERGDATPERLDRDARPPVDDPVAAAPDDDTPPATPDA
jgi:hypothetical protein